MVKKEKKGTLTKIYYDRLLIREKKCSQSVSRKSKIEFEIGRGTFFSSEGFKMKLHGCPVELKSTARCQNGRSLPWMQLKQRKKKSRRQVPFLQGGFQDRLWGPVESSFVTLRRTHKAWGWRTWGERLWKKIAEALWYFPSHLLCLGEAQLLLPWNPWRRGLERPVGNRVL